MQSEVNFLGRLSHPNLVKLLGYCWEDKELLLVYEFMQKGSLENHLFRSENSSNFTSIWNNEKHIMSFLFYFFFSWSNFVNLGISFLLSRASCHRASFLGQKAPNIHRSSSRIGFPAHFREESHIQRFQGLKHTSWWGIVLLMPTLICHFSFHYYSLSHIAKKISTLKNKTV